MKNFNIKIPNLLFYLLILFLPTQFGKHFFPAFSFVSGVRVDYLSPTLYLTDILVLFLFIFWIFSKGKFSIFNFQFLIKSKFKNFNFSNISNSFQISNFKFQIGLLAVVVFIGGIFWLSPLRFRFFDIKTTDESVVKRQELINDSFTMIKSNPIFGVGLNNFLVELPSVHKQTNNVFYLQPVHNIYLLILTQTGMIGLAFFTWFIFKTFKRLKFENSFHPDRIGIKFQILFIALALGLFDHYFLTLQQGQLLFSFALGFCWSNERGNSS